eukprot:7745731-Pyramimonas_sp.AAC.1
MTPTPVQRTYKGKCCKPPHHPKNLKSRHLNDEPPLESPHINSPITAPSSPTSIVDAREGN